MTRRFRRCEGLGIGVDLSVSSMTASCLKIQLRAPTSPAGQPMYNLTSTSQRPHPVQLSSRLSSGHNTGLTKLNTFKIRMLETRTEAAKLRARRWTMKGGIQRTQAKNATIGTAYVAGVRGQLRLQSAALAIFLETWTRYSAPNERRSRRMVDEKDRTWHWTRGNAFALTSSARPALRPYRVKQEPPWLQS